MKNIKKKHKFLVAIIPIMAIVILSISCNQSQPIDILDEPVVELIDIDKRAEFMGGNQAMFQYIMDNTVYPKTALENKIEGKIMVSFVITKNGNIEQVRILNEEYNQELGKEAVRVVKSMPGWEPAESEGKKVAMKYRLPFRFAIPKEA